MWLAWGTVEHQWWPVGSWCAFWLWRHSCCSLKPFSPLERANILERPWISGNLFPECPFQTFTPKTCDLLAIFPMGSQLAEDQKSARTCLPEGFLSGFQSWAARGAFEHGGFVCSGGEAQTNASKSPRPQNVFSGHKDLSPMCSSFRQGTSYPLLFCGRAPPKPVLWELLAIQNVSWIGFHLWY